MGIVGSVLRAWDASDTGSLVGSSGKAFAARLSVSDPQLFFEQRASPLGEARPSSCEAEDEATQNAVEGRCSADVPEIWRGAGGTTEPSASLKLSSSSTTSSFDELRSSCHVAGTRRPLRSVPILAYRKPSASHICNESEEQTLERSHPCFPWFGCKATLWCTTVPEVSKLPMSTRRIQTSSDNLGTESEVQS